MTGGEEEEEEGRQGVSTVQIEFRVGTPFLLIGGWKMYTWPREARFTPNPSDLPHHRPHQYVGGCVILAIICFQILSSLFF